MSADPTPLTTTDMDVVGYDGFMLNVERLMTSELWALSSGDEFKAALSLWCRAWKQSPAGSLPDDDRILRAFSGAGAKWPKVRAMATRGFVRCMDGRLYHRVLCEDVQRAAKAKSDRKQRTAAASEARRKTPPANALQEPPTVRDDTPDGDRDGDRDDPPDDNRYDDRDDIDTTSVTTSKGRLREVERKKERKENTPPTQTLDPEARLRVGVMTAFREANSQRFPETGRVAIWILHGWDPEICLAVVRSALVAKPDIQTLKYFEPELKRLHEQRVAECGQRPMSDPRIDFGGGYSASIATIRKLWSQGKWIDQWGPKPNVTGCLVPAEVFERETAA